MPRLRLILFVEYDGIDDPKRIMDALDDIVQAGIDALPPKMLLTEVSPFVNVENTKVVVVGNPVDGISISGPFVDDADQQEFIETLNDTWVSVELT